MESVTKKIIDFFRSWKWETGGALLLLFSVLVNLFPDGYAIVGADVTQYINLSENYKSLSYEWFGRVSLFYLPFYLLDKIGISATGQLSWYLGLFLFGAYFSFLGFARLIFPKIRGAVLAFGSLFYAANIYTLYIFTSTWGYTHYPILYVFIPILTGLYVKALQEPRKIFPGLFLLTVALASMSFSNPAFALSLGIYFVLLTIVLFVFRIVRFDRRVIGTMVVLALFAVALNAYWMLPTATQMSAGVEGVASSTDIDLAESLRKTSNTIFDTLRMVQTHEKDMFYPYNFPYPEFAWFKQILVALSLAPIALILFGFMLFRRSISGRGDLGWYLALFFMLAVLVPLVARVRAPFEFNDFLFQLPGISVLRGYDKLAIYTPFLIVTLSFLALAAREGKRYFRLLLGASFLVLFLLALPFFVGGIQTRLSAAFAGDSAKDFRKASYSSLVKIPDEYHFLRGMLSSDEDGKLTALPFSPASSVGRVDLAEWKANGPSIIPRMIPERGYVEPNEEYIPEIRFARDYDDADRDPEKLLDLYGLLGVRYIVYHKDVPADRFRKAEPARVYMEERGFIRELSETDSFFLYRLDDRFVFPYAYSGSGGFSVGAKTVDISEKVSGLRESLEPIPYAREHPRHILLPIESVPSGESIYLSEKHDNLWEAVYIAPDGSRRTLERNERVNFANAWTVEGRLSGGSIEITHKSFRWLVVGLWISGATLLLVIFFLIYRIMKHYGKRTRTNR